MSMGIASFIYVSPAWRGSKNLQIDFAILVVWTWEETLSTSLARLPNETRRRHRQSSQHGQVLSHEEKYPPPSNPHST